MNLWKRYTTIVYQNCLHLTDERAGDLLYSRNRLFVQIITYFLPISLFAIIPGIILSVASGLYLLAIVDFLAFFFIVFMGFNKRLSITLRKSLFMTVIYLVAIVLFYYLGSHGPGMLYFLSGTFFTVLIFPKNMGYGSVGINVLICIFFSFTFSNKAIQDGQYSATSWITISSNLIILSVIMVILMQRLFHSLETSINAIELQNVRLREIAWIHSHKVRSPVATIQGLAPLLDYAAASDSENQIIIEGIVQSCKQLDIIIAEITDLTSIMEIKTPNSEND